MTKKMLLVAAILLLLSLLATIVDDASMILNLKSGILVLGGTLLIGFLAFPKGNGDIVIHNRGG